jgi:thioredoxin-related protein
MPRDASREFRPARHCGVRAHQVRHVGLNILGSRKVTDFDGEELTEKQLAGKYAVRFTPTIQFFEGATDNLKQKPASEREMIRIPGYLRPDDFLDVFRYVAQKGDSNQTFRDFLKSECS